MKSERERERGREVSQQTFMRKRYKQPYCESASMQNLEDSPELKGLA